MERKKQTHLMFVLLFMGTILYCEVVFRIFTAGGLFSVSFFPLLFFSIAYGGIGYLLSSLHKSRRVNRSIAAVFLFLIGLIYLVEFLIYKQFKQFYDLNTLTGGAGDALSSYSAEILNLIFQQGGIFVMFLFVLPVLLYLLLSQEWLPTPQGNRVTRAATAVSSVVAYGIALGIIFSNGIFKPIYDSQYNFQSAVANFGLLTGMRLDLKHQLFGGGITFEVHDAIVTSGEGSSVGSSETEQETDPPSYGYNQEEIDFQGINQTAPPQVQVLNDYVQSLTPTRQNQYTGMFRGKNLIMITAEAFTAEVIDPELTPTLYRLATKGINFTDYYQPASAGTTGGEYQNLFGMFPTDGGMSFKNTAGHLNYYTMGSQLDRLGYYGKAYHNNSYTYYDRNITHNNLGYSDGFMGYGNGMEQYVQNLWPQSDYEMIKGTLPTYIDKQPFNIYYMSVSGHNSYSPGGNAMTSRHWDRVKNLPYSDAVKGYLAANLDLEDALTYLVDQLEAHGLADDTVICISADHFPYGLDSGGTLGSLPNLSELYGFSVNDYFQRDHSRLILWSGCLEDEAPIVVDSPTSSLDILPTLSNLFGTPFDSRLMVGRDVFSDGMALVFNANYDWKTDLGTYYAATNRFVPRDENTTIPEGYVEAVKAMVRNKMQYCQGVLDTDYFRYLFGH